MQKPERCKRILELLLKNADGMTGMELARHLNVSSRTIRSDIKMLQELLADQKGRLLAVPNRGYKLLPEDDAEDLLRARAGPSAWRVRKSSRTISSAVFWSAA